MLKAFQPAFPHLILHYTVDEQEAHGYGNGPVWYHGQYFQALYSDFPREHSVLKNNFVRCLGPGIYSVCMTFSDFFSFGAD